jgi:hypothetical protein
MRSVKRVAVTCALALTCVAGVIGTTAPAAAGNLRLACDCDRGYYGSDYDYRYPAYDYDRTYGDYGYYPSRYADYDRYRHYVCDPDGDRCYRSGSYYWNYREYYRRHGYHWND